MLSVNIVSSPRVYTTRIVTQGPVVNGASIAGIPYPAGTDATTFTGDNAGVGSLVVVNNNDVWREDRGKIAITYGATITVQNLSGADWPAAPILIELDAADLVLGGSSGGGGGGEPGPTGPQGPPGPQGPQGPAGTAGAQVIGGAAVVNVAARPSLGAITTAMLNGAAPANAVYRTHQYYALGVACPAVIQHWRWQAGAAPAWDTSAVAGLAPGSGGPGGFFVQSFPGDELTPEMFGAKSDYNFATLTHTTNDLEAVRAACAGSAALQIECVIRGQTYIAPTLKTHPIYLDSYARVRTEGGGAVIHDGASNGVPWFFTRNEAFIKFDCDLFFAGTLDPSNAGYFTQPEFKKFVDEVIVPTRTNINATATWGQDNCSAALLVLGGHDHLINMRCKSLIDTGSTTDVLRYKKVWLYISNGDDGVKPYRLRSDVLSFDGMIFGFLCSAVGDWSIGTLIGYRFGEPGRYTALGSPSEPGHLAYFSNHSTIATPQVATSSDKITIDDIQDYGIMTTTYNNAAHSLQVKNVRNFAINGGFSYRPPGAIAGWSQNWQIRNYYARMDWAVINSGDNIVRPLRLLTDTGVTWSSGGVWENVKYEIVNGAAGGQTAILVEGALAIDRFSFKNVVFDIDALDSAYNGILLLAGANNSDFDITINVATPNSSTGAGGGVILAWVNNGGSNNRFNVKTRGLVSSVSPRMLESSIGGSVNNRGRFERLELGQIKEYSPSGLATEHLVTKITRTATVGANLTLTGAVPPGAQVVAITSAITVALGATSGCTGYTIGVAGALACYGTVAGTTVGQGTAGVNWTSAAPPDRAPAGANLILTAVGGNFDGTGEFDVTVEYILAKLDTGFFNG